MEELDSLYENLLAELECPVCTNYMTPPIRQCEIGHGVCEHCMMKLPRCPLCRKKFTDTKNISLEALAYKMHYPCLNRPLGCDAKLMLGQREDHVKHCSFKGFECAMSNCTWSGKVEDISKHWSSKQPKRKAYQSSNVCQMKITKCGSYYINLVEAHYTGYTPHLLMFGYDKNRHADLGSNEFIIPEDSRKIAKENMNAQTLKMKKRFDAKRKPSAQYHKGNLVLWSGANKDAKEVSRKTGQKFGGPYKVFKVLVNDRYEIASLKRMKGYKRFKTVVAADSLRKWQSSVIDESSSDSEINSTEELIDLLEG